MRKKYKIGLTVGQLIHRFHKYADDAEVILDIENGDTGRPELIKAVRKLPNGKIILITGNDGGSFERA